MAEQSTDAENRKEHHFDFAAYDVDVDDFDLSNDNEAEANEEFPRLPLPIENMNLLPSRNHHRSLVRVKVVAPGGSQRLYLPLTTIER